MEKIKIDSPMGYAQAHPERPFFCENMLVTVVSLEYIELAELCLTSLFASGNFSFSQFRLVLLAYDAHDSKIINLANKFHASLVPCYIDPCPAPLAKKGILYALPHLAYAERYLYFDCDILFFDNVTKVFAKLDTIPDHHILAPSKHPAYSEHMSTMFKRIYQATEDEVNQCVGFSEMEKSSSFGINSGILAGKREAWLYLYTVISQYDKDKIMDFLWHNEQGAFWREDGLVSLLLFRHQFVTIMPCHWHINTSSQEVNIMWDQGRAVPLWDNKAVMALHFVGTESKNTMIDFGNICAHPYKKENLPVCTV